MYTVFHVRDINIDEPWLVEYDLNKSNKPIRDFNGGKTILDETRVL
jgi:hypothetical protein